jgi:hypothetical protein
MRAIVRSSQGRLPSTGIVAPCSEAARVRWRPYSPRYAGLRAALAPSCARRRHTDGGDGRTGWHRRLLAPG